MIDKEKNIRINITITKSDNLKLKSIAMEQNRSVSALVNFLISDYIKNYFN